MDLSTSLMGLSLAHPFVAGASPLGRDLDTIKRLEDNGCAAIVLPSLFEEQITLARTGRIRHVDPLDEGSASRLAGFQSADDYAFSPDEYAEHVARAKRAVRMPVVGSLNGTSNESWLTFPVSSNRRAPTHSSSTCTKLRQTSTRHLAPSNTNSSTRLPI